MSADDSGTPRALHVPAGAGRSWWVYGDKDTIKATSEDTANSLAVVETVVPPQVGPPPHIHHNENEAFYVLNGEVEVLDNDRRFRAGKGSFVFLPKGSLHAFKNVGAEPAALLLLFFPSGFEKFLMEVGQPVADGAVSSAPTDLTAAKRISLNYGLEFAPPAPKSG